MALLAAYRAASQPKNNGASQAEAGLTADEERRTRIIQTMRCLILASVALSFMLYMVSFPAAASPRSAARYLVCLLFALPVVLWPLWSGISRSAYTYSQLKERLSQANIFGRLVRFGILLSIFIVFFVGTVNIWPEIAIRRAAYNSQLHLSQDILKLGVTRIYSDYWTCARLTFQTQERLICAALDEQLHRGQDRYTPYRDIVNAAPHPGYVFPVSSPQARLLNKSLNERGSHYRRYLFENYVVYVYDATRK